MAIAHLCVHCGWDLARVRPQRDPFYRLPLAWCPRCRNPSVRRKHPMLAGWRTIRRVDAALRVLAFQCFAVAGFAALTMVSTLSLLSSTYDRMLGSMHAPIDDFYAWTLLGTLAIFAPIKGMWLTAAFSHLPPLRVWLAWFALMTLLLAFFTAMIAANEELPDNPWNYMRRGDFWTLLHANLNVVFLPGLAALGAIMLCSLPGIPLGKLIIRLWRWQRRMIWGLRRRRRRLAGACA